MKCKRSNGKSKGERNKKLNVENKRKQTCNSKELNWMLPVFDVNSAFLIHFRFTETQPARKPSLVPFPRRFCCCCCIVVNSFTFSPLYNISAISGFSPNEGAIRQSHRTLLANDIGAAGILVKGFHSTQTKPIAAIRKMLSFPDIAIDFQTKPVIFSSLYILHLTPMSLFKWASWNTFLGGKNFRILSKLIQFFFLLLLKCFIYLELCYSLLYTHA